MQAHTQCRGDVTLELWRPVRGPIAPGDAFAVTAGCDKHFATCRGQVRQRRNFRGFPHMPGNDFVSTFARTGASAS